MSFFTRLHVDSTLWNKFSYTCATLNYTVKFAGQKSIAGNYYKLSYDGRYIQYTRGPQNSDIFTDEGINALDEHEKLIEIFLTTSI